MKKQHFSIPLSKISNKSLVPYINKAVDFMYHGEKLKLLLSHALFSSFDVDDGTKLLLKTVAQNVDFSNIRSLRDVGCGTGVIGLSLKKKYPALEVHFSDRDAMALLFTSENCLFNGIKDFKVSGELGIRQGSYDLILSNIPAKIGEPVFHHFIANCLNSHNPGGLCGIVVIDAFKGLLEEAVKNAGGEILFSESTKRHTVFHFRRPGDPVPQEEPAGLSKMYIRRQGNYKMERVRYPLDTVFNLPDFDQPGYQSLLAAKLAAKAFPKGRVLVWNPGQGHISSFLQALCGKMISSYTIGSRDLLQVEAACRNLAAQGVPQEKFSASHVAELSAFDESFHMLFLFPDPIPTVPWHTSLLADAAGLTKEKGKIILTVKSTYATRILEHSRGFHVIRKFKEKGFTAILLEKSV